MSELSKVEKATAGEVCGLYEPDEEASALLDEALAPGDYLLRLMEGELFRSAAQFLAYALPKREAVWWACLCAREALPEEAAAAVQETLEAAEAWVLKPNEDNRRAAWAKAEAAGMDSPSAWAAAGAFWSGGSLAPPDNPAVIPPAENLTGAAVSGSILLAAVAGDALEIDDKLKAFLKRGLDIAKGGSGR
jgi:hypothetical protein